MTRCHMATLQSGNRISTNVPTEKDEEWTYISMDAALKLCLKLKGQELRRAPADVRNAAPFEDEVGWSRLLTVR